MKTKPLFVAGALLAGVLPVAAAPARPTTPPKPAANATARPAAPKPNPRPASTVAITDLNIEVAAEVGPDKIMMRDINRLVRGIVDDQPKLAEDTPEAKENLKKIRTQLLDNMIAQQLMYQEAVKRNLKPTTEQVDKAVWEYQKALDLSDSAFDKWLAEEGKTRADIRALMTKRLSIDLLKHDLLKDVTLTQADLDKFYDENKADFVVPETVIARHIQISFPRRKDKNGKDIPGVTADDKKKTKDKAQSILKKAMANNADFAALAKENSDDEISKSRGGVVDMPEVDQEMRIRSFRPISRADKEGVDPAFFEALFSAPVGKVHKDLVETEYGFHILKVEERKPSRTLALSEIANAIRPMALSEKAKNKIDQTVAALSEQVKPKKNI